MTATGIYGLVWLFAITVTAAFYFVGLVNEVTLPSSGSSIRPSP